VETIVLFRSAPTTQVVRHVPLIPVVVGVVLPNNVSQELPLKLLRPPFVPLDNGLTTIALAILNVSMELALVDNALVSLVSLVPIVLSRLIATEMPCLQENLSPNSMFAMFVEEMEVLVLDVMEFHTDQSTINAESAVGMELPVGTVVVLQQPAKPVPNQKTVSGALHLFLKTKELEPPLLLKESVEPWLPVRPPFVQHIYRQQTL